MGAKRIIRFNITPQVHVRATQGDRIFFKIPRDRLRPAGLKRLLRLEKYNDYKTSIAALAKEQQFVFPNQGAWIRFYLPCPKTWSQKKRKRYHGSPHMARGDIDNFCKAIFDSLFSEDKYIFHFQASKQWVDFPTGWIEFEVADPIFPEIPSA